MTHVLLTHVQYREAVGDKWEHRRILRQLFTMSAQKLEMT